MAFQGYFVKVGNYEFPTRLINAESYQAKVNTLDQDSYTDDFGTLHRTVVQAIPIVSFQTVDWTQTEVDVVMNAFRSQFIGDKRERKALVSAWVPEYGNYVQQYMYMSDPDFSVDYTDGKNVYYEGTTLKFNSYGER